MQPKSDETIIEIGPGRGALTGRLLETGARVVAIEFDRALIPQLREQFAGSANFTLIEADALTVDFCRLVATRPRGSRSREPSVQHRDGDSPATNRTTRLHH